jgi:hypothetical protein
MKEQNPYRVWLRSKPGPYEQYNGKIDVTAYDEDDAVAVAFKKLKAGSFPDRNSSMWIIEKVERRHI